MVQCRLKTVLWDRHLKLTDLSRMTGVDYTTLLRLYHRKGKGIHFRVLEQICKALHCTPGDILTIDFDNAE